MNLTGRSINLVPGSNTETWKQNYDKFYSEPGSSVSEDSTQNRTRNQQPEKPQEDPWDLGQVLPYKKRPDGQFEQQSKTNFGCTR